MAKHKTCMFCGQIEKDCQCKVALCAGCGKVLLITDQDNTLDYPKKKKFFCSEECKKGNND